MTLRGITGVHAAPAMIVEEASTSAAASMEFMFLARETLQLFEAQRKALDAQIRALDERLAKLRMGLSVVEEKSKQENGGTEFRTTTTYHKDRTEVVTEAVGANSVITPSAASTTHQDNIELSEIEQGLARQAMEVAGQTIRTLNADLIEPMSVLDEAMKGNVVSIQVTHNESIQYQLFNFKFDALVGGLEGLNGLAKKFTELVSACGKLAELTEYAKKWRSLLSPKTLWLIILPSDESDPALIVGTSRRQFVVDVHEDAARIAHASSINLDNIEGLLARPGRDVARGVREYLNLFPQMRDAWMYFCDEQQADECRDLPIRVCWRPPGADSVGLFAGDRLDVFADHSRTSPVFEFRLGDRSMSVSDDPSAVEGRASDLVIAGRDHCRLRDHLLDISQTPTLIELTLGGSGAIVRRWAPQ